MTDRTDTMARFIRDSETAPYRLCQSTRPPSRDVLTPADLDVATLTIAGEARGEDVDGQVAVAAVLLERLVTGYRAHPDAPDPRGGHDRGMPCFHMVDGAGAHPPLVYGFPRGSLGAVCLSPWQFSAWNDGDPNRAYVLTLEADDPVYQRANRAIHHAIDHQADVRAALSHARHYHATSMDFPRAWGRPREPVATIGNHVFYADVP